MRVLVCGGRDFMDETVMRERLARLPSDTEVCHGAARGADNLGGYVAAGLGFPVTAYAAQWSTYGKAAGPKRNQWMLDDFKPDLVLAFPTPKSIGTWDMVDRARRAGVPVEIHEPRAPYL